MVKFLFRCKQPTYHTNKFLQLLWVLVFLEHFLILCCEPDNNPRSIPVGTPALTSRQFKESDFVQVVAFIDEAVQLAAHVKAKTGNIYSVWFFFIKPVLVLSLGKILIITLCANDKYYCE